MRKALIILLIPLFTLATVGLSITSLFCQGKLCKIGFTVHPCCDDVNKGGCCETRSILLKIVDSFVKESKDAAFNAIGFEKSIIPCLSLRPGVTCMATLSEGTENRARQVLPSADHIFLRLCTFLI
jgi:hypothetical protein